jgi:hypothetical protein
MSPRYISSWHNRTGQGEIGDRGGRGTGGTHEALKGAMSSSGETVEMPVLTVGGRPIRLALACDLGLRGASYLMLKPGEGQ